MRLANITWPQAEAYFKEHDMVLMGGDVTTEVLPRRTIGR